MVGQRVTVGMLRGRRLFGVFVVVATGAGRPLFVLAAAGCLVSLVEDILEEGNLGLQQGRNGPTLGLDKEEGIIDGIMDR